MDCGDGEGNALTVTRPLLLDDDELQKYQRAFVRDGKYNLDSQVPLIEKLADRYLERYECGKSWVDALKSHSLYNSVGYRKPSELEWADRAFHVQQKCLKDAMKIDFEKSQTITIVLSKILEEIRLFMKAKLKALERITGEFRSKDKNSNALTQKFDEQVKNCSLHCAEKMHVLAERVFMHSVASMSQLPPCAFEVVSMGSMARGEVTPYSDLEYMFLIEERNEATVEYFEKLAMMSYFIIGNLRETRLTNMAISELYGWFDDQQMCGFRIDSLCTRGGYIPTGNGQQTKNRFILTPDELLDQYRIILDNPVEEDVKVGDLTSVLHYTSLLYQCGEGRLLQQFVSKKSKLDINLTEERKKANVLMFQEDAKKYNFRPETHLIEHAHSVNSKKELYRFPSILLFNISILTGIRLSDSWATLQALLDNHLISDSLHRSLAFLLACSCYVRLSTYLFHDSQDDRVSVLRASTYNFQTDNVVATAGRRWYLPMPIFLEICLQTIPLKEHISRCQKTEVLALIKEDVDPPNWLMKFQAFHCCHRWLDAWELFQMHITKENWASNTKETVETLMNASHQDLTLTWLTIKALGYLLFQQRLYDHALGFYLTFFEIIQKSLKVDANQKHRTITDLYHELGFGNVHLYQHHTALIHFEDALKICERYKLEDEQIVKTYSLIGRCLRQMKEHSKAEAHLFEALQIYNSLPSHETAYDYYGDPIPQTMPRILADDVSSADAMLENLNGSTLLACEILWNLGYVLLDLKWYQRALIYFEKAKKVGEELYGQGAYHKDLCATYHCIGHCYTRLRRHSDADVYWRKSAAMIIELFGLQTMSDKVSASDKNSKGNDIDNKKYYELVVSLFYSLPGYKESHVESAEICVLAAEHVCFMKQHDLAHSMLEKTIDIYKSANSSGLYTEDIAKSQSVQGINFWENGDIENAEKKFNEALSTLSQVNTQSGKLEAAETLQNVGLMYAEQKDYHRARNCLSQSQALYVEHCKDSRHSKLTEIEEQLCKVVEKLNECHD